MEELVSVIAKALVDHPEDVTDTGRLRKTGLSFMS